MDDTTGQAMVVDPCPEEGRLLLEAFAAGWLDLDDDDRHRGVLAPWQFTDKALLRELTTAQCEVSKAYARWLGLLAEADRREATLELASLPTAGWLTDQNTHWARSAREQVRFAAGLAAQPEVAEALAAGGLSVEQARVIITGLDRLPAELDPARREQVAVHLVELGGQFGPYGLSRLVNKAVEVVAPEVVEDADRRAVERAEAEQQRGRYLSWCRDHEDGSWLLRGKLPAVAGEQLIGLVKVLGAKARKAAALAGEELSRGQAHADALVLLADHYTGCKKPPRLGADRPRILINIDYNTLRGELGTATLLNTGETISAGEARRLACDAGILPVVMGGNSVPLDVGRERRLFTSHLRALLIARDQGCAFPGCDVGPAECEAHHRRPWWAGGETSLDNGVLQCRFHHHVIEPVPGAPPGTQWAIRLDARGNPEFGAPEGQGAPPGQRRWRQHHRYQTT